MMATLALDELNNHVVQTPLLLTIIPSLENTFKNNQFEFNFKLFPLRLLTS